MNHATVAPTTKLLRSVISTIGYVIWLFAFYFLHVRFLRVDVVFYSAMSDALAAAVASSAMLFLIRYFSVFNRFEIFQMIVIWLLLGYAYAISVPTVIDRSLSFYMLEKMQQRGGGIRMDRFEDIFTREYSREHQLVAVRLTEQQASGSVTISNGCVRLTERGQRLADFSQFFRRYLLPRHRLLMGKYTDRLTRPFPQDARASADSCR